MHNNNYKDNFTIRRNHCKQTGKFVENVQIANTPSHQSDFWQLTRVQGKHKRNAKAKESNAHKALQNEFGHIWSTTGVKLRGIYFKKILCWSGLAFGVFFANAISNIYQGLQVSSVVLSRHVFFSFFLFFSLLPRAGLFFSLKAFFLPGLGWGLSLFLYFLFSFR